MALSAAIAASVTAALYLLVCSERGSCSATESSQTDVYMAACNDNRVAPQIAIVRGLHDRQVNVRHRYLGDQDAHALSTALCVRQASTHHPDRSTLCTQAVSVSLCYDCSFVYQSYRRLNSTIPARATAVRDMDFHRAMPTCCRPILARYWLWAGVCLSVCLLQVGVRLKRLDGSSY